MSEFTLKTEYHIIYNYLSKWQHLPTYLVLVVYFGIASAKGGKTIRRVFLYPSKMYKN